MREDRQQVLQNKIGTEVIEFRNEFHTIQLATVNDKGEPNASYAPFVYHNDQYVVLISEMAKHARNLQVVPRVSLLLIEDEKTARELFARKRLTTNANARLVDKESEEGKTLLTALRDRHGERIDGLARLSDFKLFCFSPLQSLYVKGFGQAFHLDKEGNVIHLRGGHGHGHKHDTGHDVSSSKEK
ncbi:pyridoxamine 5'-phosphate oxidase family protein [Ursidibacter maritimus]|uniref:Pyridoxamine 5'-phosphate oxidase family protein n=1 Tax=Ursidibacter maritimus TaxID=1331689 RepID=A0A949T0A5_9PAST|nr:pyridoxamine 5'-phosphate oxidase family protein [Ursidibacter maritimus]KAE9538438.1 heme utilization protein HutZ [Ursidibacter maritimus]MBV6523485.1 pyridoxamine 5'-phosphate oxidase family protein [Ursidibacter maritimus]MBV6525830.1 pyridoxamine 5'-phosphate oxidase family protein [Ursidibacter maritimus]MBV6528170.1 pyridoxamine 5'-phosphate oxidase family protein [Ursidibacter maritimus]MBV6529301.1 pyridoxamine 5'-phosphate oxidase family protein [Ursidibacter maritimus]